VYDCEPESVAPGLFSSERSFRVPDVEPGEYRLVALETGAEGRINVERSYVEVELHAGEYTIDVSHGFALEDVGDFMDDYRITRAVVVNGNKLALAWRSACNAPAKRVSFSYPRATTFTPGSVAATLELGAFMVIDCVGEPDDWTLVVDLPAPLQGRDVVVNGELTAEHMDATVVSPPSAIVADEVGDPTSARTRAGEVVASGRLAADYFNPVCGVNAGSSIITADRTVFVRCASSRLRASTAGTSSHRSLGTSSAAPSTATRPCSPPDSPTCVSRPRNMWLAHAKWGQAVARRRSWRARARRMAVRRFHAASFQWRT
jgi:hypothetical protein